MRVPAFFWIGKMRWRGMRWDDKEGAMEEAFFDEMELHVDPVPHSGAWNMAVDQALLERGGLPVLRVYGWDRPTVTLGYAQSLSKLADALPDWPVVRRWTGGGVVFHGEDFTYTVMVPAGHPWAETRPVESYRLIHGALAGGLVAAGLEGCRLAEAEDVKDLPFCFEAPALHDVIRGAVKVAGAGQRRGRLGLLHQGSVQRLVLKPGFWAGWAGRLAREVRVVEALPEAVRVRAEALEAKRYSLPEWLESRDDQLG
jgi:lipoate-protein ligase A